MRNSAEVDPLTAEVVSRKDLDGEGAEADGHFLLRAGSSVWSRDDCGRSQTTFTCQVRGGDVGRDRAVVRGRAWVGLSEGYLAFSLCPLLFSTNSHNMRSYAHIANQQSFPFSFLSSTYAPKFILS